MRNIIFPCSPTDPRSIDPDFADQAMAAEVAGFSVHLYSFEDLVYDDAPHHSVYRVSKDAGPCLYRGWMLGLEPYSDLAEALSAKGSPLVVNPMAYAYAHHLPKWYADFEQVTAQSVWVASTAAEHILSALRRLPPGPAIVKDYVKSAKHLWHEACFIPDVHDERRALEVINTFIAHQDILLNGGVVLRTFRPYKSSGVDTITGAPIIEERRVFLWHGSPLIFTGDEGIFFQDPRISEAVSRLQSPFVSVDFAKLEDGSWEVVEVGDGQVSGIRDMDPRDFYRALKVATECF